MNPLIDSSIPNGQVDIVYFDSISAATDGLLDSIEWYANEPRERRDKFLKESSDESKMT